MGTRAPAVPRLPAYLCGARQRYATAKRDAAATWADDGIAFTDAKSKVILDLLADAEVWIRTID
jgi:GrpB-like predicted nucleotidyltransferase (UPF0157 family)